MPSPLLIIYVEKDKIWGVKEKIPQFPIFPKHDKIFFGICYTCFLFGEKRGVFMKDVFRKLALAGIGAFSLTREKAEQIVKELVERGQVSAEEAKGVFRDLIEKGEQERAALVQAIRSEINRFREEVGFVTKQDLKALEERISRLEAQTGQTAGQGGEPPPQQG